MKKAIGILIALAGWTHVANGAPTDCHISIHLHDPVGRTLAGAIASVAEVDEGRIETATPLETIPNMLRLDGLRIVWLLEPSLGTGLMVGIRLKTGQYVQERFNFGGCGQRRSVVVGNREVGNGEGMAIVRGKLTGCRNYDGWWVRLSPMFGERGKVLEANVDQKNGAFQLADYLMGVRHVLVLGHADSAFSAIGVNIQSGGESLVDGLDVGKWCPGNSRQ